MSTHTIRTRRAVTASLAVVALLVFVSLAFTTGTATQDTNFEVEMTAPEAVDAGEDLMVAVTVTNRGPGNDTQELVLTDSDGNRLDSQSVTLGDGESTDIELTWSDVPEDVRSVNPEVSSQTDADAAVVTVRWASFEIAELDPTSTSIEANGSFSLSATVRNVGTIDDEQDVVLSVAGEEYAVKQNVSIPAEEFTTVRFVGVEPELEPGEYSYTVGTDNDTQSGSLTVEEVPEAEFVITDIEGQYANGTATVEAVIENQGNVEDSQAVQIRVDDELADERLLTLAPGESTGLTFTHDPASVPVNVTIQTQAPDAASVRVGRANIEFGPRVNAVTPADIQLGDEITVTYTASGENLAETRLLVYGPDGAVAFEQSLPAGIEREFRFSQSALSPYNEGGYDVVLAATDEFGRTDTHRVGDAFTAEASFDEGPVVETVSPTAVDLGDQLNVSYTVTGTNLVETELLVYGPDGAVAYEQRVPFGRQQNVSLPQEALSPYRQGAYDVELAVTDAFGETETRRFSELFEATAVVQDGPNIGSIVPEFVQADDTLFINYTAGGRNIQAVNLVLTGPGGEVVRNDTVPQGAIQRYAVPPEERAEFPGGPYNVTLELHDAFGNTVTRTREDAFEVGRQYNPDDGNFGADVYTTTAGDFVEIDVTLNEVDEAYILVGEGASSDTYGLGGPLDILHVSGSSSFVVNTRLFGTDRDGEDVYITQDGSVTSYAHDLGAGSAPTGVFEDLRFETTDGEQVATNLSQFRRHVHVSRQFRPLQPGSYGLTLGTGDSIVVREDGLPDPRFPLDRAELELTEPTLGEVTTWRIPRGNADELGYQVEEEPEELTPDNLGALRDSGIQTNNITLGERVLVGFEASGIWGSMLDTVESPDAVTGGAEPRLLSPGEFEAFLDREDGVNLTVAHGNPGPNTAMQGIDLFNATTNDVSVLLVPYFGEESTEMGEIYLLVDTRQPKPFEQQPEAGQRFDVTVSYESVQGERYTFTETEIGDQPSPFDAVRDEFPYFTEDDESQQRTTSFTIREQVLRYNRTTVDGEPIVTNDAGATISGVTNYIPGDRPISIVVDVRNREDRTVEIEDVTIGPNGTFEVGPDLAGIDPDSDVWIEFWAYEELVDERPLALFEDPDQFTTFEVSRLQTQTLVREQEGPILNVSAVIANTGSLSGVADVELLIDGQVVTNRTVEVERGRNSAVSFPQATDEIEPGQHTVEVRTKDDLNGTLVTLDSVRSVFEVQSFGLSESPTTNASTVEATATVINTGTVREAKPVELLLDGQVIGERNRTLLADEDLTAVFEDAIGDLEPGNYTLTLRTPDDEQSRPLVVEEPDDDGEGTSEESGNDDGDSEQPEDESPESGDAPSDSGDSAPGAGGIFGVGAGSRAVVGGTAIVGAVYVLGYWV